MGIRIEELNQISQLGIKKHVQIVDGYIASGLSLDDLTIHYAVDQERIAWILHGYGFGMGSSYGDPSDSIKKYKGLPFPLVEAYITANYPGFLEGSDAPSTDLEGYLDQHHPQWRTLINQPRKSMYFVSPEELNQASSTDVHRKPSHKSGFFSRFKRK